MPNAHNSSRGFSMLELLVASTVGLLMIAGATLLFSQVMKASWVTSQKSEMQQDFRAAGNIMQTDISLAGAGALGQQGLSNQSIGIPSGTIPIYPCSNTLCNYVNGGSVAYNSTTGVTSLYSIMPGPSLGITVNGNITDILTVSYADASLPINCYNITGYNFGAATVTFQLPASLASTCVLPANIVTPPALNDSVVGLQPGDTVLFGANSALGVVTSCVLSGANTYTVTFANTDPGHINQSVMNQIKLIPSITSTSAVRLLTITYYLDISPADGKTPRLMRIQNGKLPAPVAENVVDLKFTYDINTGTAIVANLSSIPAGDTPAMITQINIAHMVMRSQLPGTTGYQGLDLQTSISARNLSSQQEYPISGSSY